MQLKKPKFWDKKKPNILVFVSQTQDKIFPSVAEELAEKIGLKKNSFIYSFMSSLRQKVNDPLGVRAKKRKEISQR